MIDLADIQPNLWFADTEVFAYDNIWVFEHYGTGEVRTFVNDPDGVTEFINTENPVLCGYNIHGYDIHILKAVLAGFPMSVIKNINDTIIFGGEGKYEELWSYFRGVWVDIPYYIDLFHDIVPRRSLKVIEGNLEMSVKESDVSFDIDRPLTDGEIEQTIVYCRHDVHATSVLYEHRREYLQSKLTLCDICGEDAMRGLRFSNARLLSEVFHAKSYEFDVSEEYEIPPQVDTSRIPAEVLDYVAQIDCSVATGDTDFGKLELDFYGVPTVFGLGGVHSADSVPYYEQSTDDRVMLIQDITSYYPSIILRYGYMSRAIAPECADLYEQFYDLRVEAKKNGNKADANAAKLVLNTFSGGMGDRFNKLYDPMMPLAMRITGQLAILDAVACAMESAPSARFIQLNTDGWVLSVDRCEYDAVIDAVSEWEHRTGFSVDTQEVRTLIQRDVNNYILEDANGNVKVKGGTVGLWGGTDFKANSMSICHEAIVEYLLHGVPIEDTINACDDIGRFQLIAKTGSTFDCTEWDVEDGVTRELHMCNRIFASTIERHGRVYKVKRSDDGVHRTKVANCPDHALVVNGDLDDKNIRNIVIKQLDKPWYIKYSMNKAKAFVKGCIGYGGQRMSAEIEELNEEVKKDSKPAPKRKTAPKSTAKKDTEPKKSLVEKAIENDPQTLAQALFKLQVLMSGNSGSVKLDGFINNINYAYADTQQYKTLLAKCANECGLIFSVTNVKTSFPQLSDETDARFGNPIDSALNGIPVNEQCYRLGLMVNDGNVISLPELGHGKQIMCIVEVEMQFMFLDGETKTYTATGMGVGMQGNSLSIAETNAFRNFITNNFLMDNKGREGDDVATNFMDELAERAQTPYVSDSEKAKKKASIVEEKKGETVFATAQYAKALYPKLKKAAEKDKEFAEKIKDKMALLYKDNGDPITRESEGDPEHSVMKRAGAAKLMREAEEIID